MLCRRKVLWLLCRGNRHQPGMVEGDRQRCSRHDSPRPDDREETNIVGQTEYAVLQMRRRTDSRGRGRPMITCTKCGARWDPVLISRRRQTYCMDCGEPFRLDFLDPFSPRALAIAERAVRRADTHGMANYGAAPEPLDEKRDLYEEAIEELLDAIYYLTRQVARLEDQRSTLASSSIGAVNLNGKGDGR